MGRRRERALPFVILFLLALAVIVLPLARGVHEARRMVANEDEAVRVLTRLRSAEVVLRAERGHYGWLGDLAQAGLIPDLVVEDEPSPPHVVLDGYRIDVLLPYGHVGGNIVGLVTEADARDRDPTLSQDHVSLVARPLAPAETGWRMYYLDEDDRLFVNEGVTDPESAERNQLPKSQVKEPQPQLSSRPHLWQLAEGIADA